MLSMTISQKIVGFAHNTKIILICKGDQDDHNRENHYTDYTDL